MFLFSPWLNSQQQCGGSAARVERVALCQKKFFFDRLELCPFIVLDFVNEVVASAVVGSEFCALVFLGDFGV